MGSNCQNDKPNRPVLCCPQTDGIHGWDCKYRQILVVVLLINAVMFLIELLSGIYADSQALLADSIDFFSDAANYAISLYVLNKSMNWRAGASIIKGGTMALFGLWILGSTIYKVFFAAMPSAEIMGGVAIAALVANVFCAFLLFKYRGGDINRESVWICSRNDAIGNIAVMVAALGVFASETHWPDLIVAAIIASMAISGAYHIIRKAIKEITTDE